MKTIDVPEQDDEVIGTVDTADGPMVRVRRPVAFLRPVDARRISTVASPASGMTFAALKVQGAAPVEAEKPSNDKPFDKAPPGVDTGGNDGGTMPEESSQKAATPITTPTTSTPAQNAVKRFVDGLKRLLTGADSALLADLEAATAPVLDAHKAEVGQVAEVEAPAPTLSQVLARREAQSKFWDLDCALDSVVHRLFFDDEYSGDRVADLDRALADYSTQTKALLTAMAAVRTAAKAAACGDKPGEPGEKAKPDPADQVADQCGKACGELQHAAGAVAREASKAGKVISSENVERLRAAMGALRELLAAAGVADSASAPAAGDAGKGGIPGTRPVDSAVPGMDAATSTPWSHLAGAGAEEDKAMKEQAVKAAHEALKAAKTDAERAAAMTAMEEALKAAPAPVATPEMDALKAQVAGLTTAVEGLVDVVKALPGISAPGLVQDPTGDRLGREVDAAEETEEEVLQGGASSFPGDPVPSLFSTPTVTVPGNGSVNVGMPAQKALEAQVAELRGQVSLLTGMIPASKAAAAGNGGPQRPSWGTGGLVR